MVIHWNVILQKAKSSWFVWHYFVFFFVICYSFLVAAFYPSPPKKNRDIQSSIHVLRLGFMQIPCLCFAELLAAPGLYPNAGL